MSECDPECEAMGIPRHLHQLERPVDPVFDGEELLYRRYPAGTPDLTAAISFERMSVNRGKYCESADDTLWDDRDGSRYSGCGVFALPVQALDVMEKHPQEDYRFTLRPEHRPNRCNYLHSEVVATKVLPDGTEESLADIKPKSVKLKLRQALRDYLVDAIPADSG